MGAAGVSGVQPHYGIHTLVGVSAAIGAIQIVFVAARFYTRFMQRIKFGVDDYLILLALTASLARSVIYIVLTKAGSIGYHIDYITQMPDKVLLMRKCIVALQALDYPLTATPTKLALLVFYLRIFTTRKFRILVYIVGSLVLVVGIGALLQDFFQCRPFVYAWDRSIPGGTCVRLLESYRVFAPLNALTGILILVMPIPVVWKLQAPRGQKLALTGVFLLGGL
ncbi:hypothetical protein N7457_004589 [Penicillium paradoxum]|uniref:uncharacterized protein n=1 Tax=Penicillium paradoxum TaxID=176176 RepID=UPI00254864CA|nr:uncharacterized protein N7457_004589 [Penicillium paradoxum]KAJ5782815.1 hypothetical protein N7457_004589 [Penicillium paradoxum]